MGKFQALRAGLNLFKSEIVSANSKRLFSFARKHKLKSNGKLSEDGLILTHLSNHAPSNGFIDTARSATGMSRDSVHFAVNHGVQGHVCAWNDSEYAILMPMKNARQIAENKFSGGVAADFYSKGKVKIPKGSVIVRRNINIPEGKYRISDASKIEEFKQLHGVKIIETSSPDMVLNVDNIIHRLGYKVKSGDFTSWGGSLPDFNLFNSYLKGNGMKPMFHTYTPNGKTELLIDHIQTRANKIADWIVKDKTGKVILDYKQEYLKTLKYIENYAQKTGYPKNFDTKQIAEIIQTSKTPQEAIKLFETKLKIKPMGIFAASEHESDFLLKFRLLVGGDKYAEMGDNNVLNYLKHADNANLQKMLEAPNGIEAIPDQLIEANPSVKKSITDICKKYGIKNVDNSLANKLYELG